jgi:DNA-directed RNA polymerase specialized sigma24 family protein
MIVLASATGMAAPQIAEMIGAPIGLVVKVIAGARWRCRRSRGRRGR